MSNIHKYGFPFGDDVDQFHVELAAYSFCRAKMFPNSRFYRDMGFDPENFGFLGAEQHLINAAKLGFPQGVFDLDSRGYPNTTARRIIKAWCEHSDIGLAGAASLSKTFCISACVLLDWLSAADCTLSMVGSTGISASSDRIWGQICYLYDNCLYRVGKKINYLNMIVFDKFTDEASARENLNSIKAVALPRGAEGAQALAQMRGRKNSRVVLVFDELPEMDLNVCDVRINLRSNKHFSFVGIGNPTPVLNPHTELCTPADARGFDSVTENDEQWETKTGICLFLSGNKSPNFLAPEGEPPPFPYLLTREDQLGMLKLAGGNEKAIEYIRNADGWCFQVGSSQLTVLSKDVIRASDTTKEPLWDSRGKVGVGALDPAFTAGGDGCVATYGFVAWISGLGKQVGYMSLQKEYYANSDENYEDSIARQVVEDCVKFHISPENFGLDISNDGGKVSTAIIREWLKINPMGASIVPISSQGSPSERIISREDKRQAINVYDRLVTEHWFRAAIGVRSRCIYGLHEDSDAAKQLCQRLYIPYGRSQLKVETKKEMKSRIKRSPDNADSFTYFVFMCQRAGVEFKDDSQVVSDKKNNIRFDRSKRKEPVNIGTYSSDDWGE